jgi:hypothetical protein
MVMRNESSVMKRLDPKMGPNPPVSKTYTLFTLTNMRQIPYVFSHATLFLILITTENFAGKILLSYIFGFYRLAGIAHRGSTGKSENVARWMTAC